MTRTLVVLSSGAEAGLPVEALPALRAAAKVCADATVAASLVEAAGAVRLTDPVCWPPDSVLLTSDRGEHALTGQADNVVTAEEPPGSVLRDAVAVMDRLRSEGGCPWDAEQTHSSLLQYLVEETYELHEAIDDADRGALREELGDVLLQVLFHSRLAQEGSVEPFRPGAEPFGIDEVAGDLVSKLVSRHPHVFGDDAPLRDATQQEYRWDELKQQEKQRESAMDGVATGQPAAALAAKLVSRARKAGVPRDLIERGSSSDTLWGAVVDVKLSDADPEQRLRSAARRFDESVRAAESAARAAGRDSHALTENDWHTFWPS